MRNAVFGMTLLFTVAGCLTSGRAVAAPTLVNEAYWAKVAKLVSQCAVQPYSTDARGKKVYSRLRSICSELAVSGQEARFQIDGETYAASLKDSPNADGGDLGDLSITDSHGAIVAQRNDVPAFGDVLLALAGGRADAHEVQDPAIVEPTR